MRKLAVATLALSLIAACGGSAGETEPAKTDAPSASTAPDQSDEPATPAETALTVESQTAIHLPDQSGGNFYEVIVVVQNDSDEVALGVTGQLSLKDETATYFKASTQHRSTFSEVARESLSKPLTCPTCRRKSLSRPF